MGNSKFLKALDGFASKHPILSFLVVSSVVLEAIAVIRGSEKS